MFVALPVDAAGRSRLLPWTLPFRFFVTAALFHAAAWPLLLAAAADVPRFQGGLGPVLGALHAITLGTLLSTVMGASLQLLPVATVQAVASERLAAVLWWVFTPSTACLVAGMSLPHPTLLAAGTAGTIAAVLLFAGLLGHNLARARRQQDSVLHGWVAWGAMLLAAATAALLVRWYGGAALPDPRAFARAHLVLGVFGFMTVLAAGFSYILVPMFAVTKQPAEGVRRGVLGAAVAGVVLALAGTFLDASPWLLGGAAGVGTVAAAVHVGAMAREVRRRMRPEMGPWFALVALGWAMLVACLPVGLAVAAGAWPQRGPALFGALAVGGWLLSFVLGILSRIAPFLASVHAMGSRRAPPLVATLTPMRPLRAHQALHALALAGVLAGIAADSGALVRAGAALGCAGGIACLVFVAGVVRRLRKGRSQA